jgi:hypothetical protein
MGDLFKDIFPALLGVVFCAWWWFIAKEAATRKYILALGICWLVMGISYSIAKSVDILALRGALGMIGVFVFLGSIYFLIKAALSERKAKKKPPDD